MRRMFRFLVLVLDSQSETSQTTRLHRTLVTDLDWKWGGRCVGISYSLRLFGAESLRLDKYLRSSFAI